MGTFKTTTDIYPDNLCRTHGNTEPNRAANALPMQHKTSSEIDFEKYLHLGERMWSTETKVIRKTVGRSAPSMPEKTAACYIPTHRL